MNYNISSGLGPTNLNNYQFYADHPPVDESSPQEEIHSLDSAEDSPSKTEKFTNTTIAVDDVALDVFEFNFESDSFDSVNEKSDFETEEGKQDVDSSKEEFNEGKLEAGTG